MTSNLVRLPTTTEDALNRYLFHYDRCFIGPAADLYRLKSFTEAFVHRLRKVAPNFYREKLPTLINQAASHLLVHNINTDEGRKKFHETHCYFLSILKDLKSTQPAGDINFEQERDRLVQRQALFKRQLELKKRITQLEAADFDWDVLGDDETDSAYLRTIRELDEAREEMKRVTLKIIHMEGEQLEQEPDFQLRVVRNSQLGRLSAEQIKNLEQQMIAYYQDNNKKKNAMYVDKSIIDGMIEKLNVDMSHFTKVELNEMSKNALDAYKGFWRELDEKRREQYHEELLRNKALEPKEGIKFASPYDIPEEARRELDTNDLKYKQQFEELIEKYAERQTADDAPDNVDDELEDNPDGLPELMSAIQKNTEQYARVKEEPRDDYFDEDSPGEEIYVGEDVAEAVVDGQEVNWSKEDIEEQRMEYERDQRQNRGSTSGEDYDDEENEVDVPAAMNGFSYQHNGAFHVEHVKQEENGLSDDVNMSADANLDDDDDEEIECLGTVEPADKIKTLDVE